MSEDSPPPCYVCGVESVFGMLNCSAHLDVEASRKLFTSKPSLGLKMMDNIGIPDNLTDAVNRFIDYEALDYHVRLMCAVEDIAFDTRTVHDAADVWGFELVFLQRHYLKYDRSGKARCAVHPAFCKECAPE